MRHQVEGGSGARLNRTDVVIVGAGAAGLMAARELRAKGLSTVVLEARDRFGGRIWTHRDPRVPLPIELGAEFVHGSSPLTENLLAQAGESVLDVSGERRAVARGRLRRLDFWPAIDRVMRHLEPKGEDESFAAFLARRPGGRALARDRGAAREFVEGFHAADLDEISAQSIAPEEGESPTESAARIGRPRDGYATLLDKLARELGPALRLRTEVRAIAWRRGRAEIVARSARGSNTRWAARAVIVTVPIGVLKAPRSARGSIAFDPELPGVDAALDKLRMGSVVRLCLWLREFPWARERDTDLERLSFIHLANGPFRIMWTAYPVRGPFAVAWSGGPAAARLSRMARSETLRVARTELARALGTTPARMRRSIRRVWWQNWERDPHARGAYSYVRVGGGSAARELARPVSDTVFIAGEAVGPESGTVEAALASGRRAAKQVVSALGF